MKKPETLIATYQCPHCGKELSASVDVFNPDSERYFTKAKEYLRETLGSFVIKHLDEHKRIEYRTPTGGQAKNIDKKFPFRKDRTDMLIMTYYTVTEAGKEFGDENPLKKMLEMAQSVIGHEIKLDPNWEERAEMFNGLISKISDLTKKINDITDAVFDEGEKE